MSALLSPLKQVAKTAVQTAAARFGRHRYSGRDAQLWVLMYHRILPSSDPRHAGEEPGMIVTPESFRQQLQIIKQRFTVLPLSEWVERKARGQALPRRACAVTFDDGWLDNFEYALPILLQEQVPATVFAVSAMIGTPAQFWPNRLLRLLQGPNLQRLESSASANPWLATLATYARGGALNKESGAALIAASKHYSDHFLQDQLDALEQQLGVLAPTQPDLMDWPQLLAMQATGLVEIGSHTCDHYRLVDELPAAVLEQQIVQSQRQLEAQLGRRIALFCYPNGNVSAVAAELVGRHYAAAVTTARGINGRDVDLHRLSRVGIHEDVADTATRFEARLSGWPL